MADKVKEAEAFLTYKGRPLVRSGKMLYYGSMAEKCVVMMRILTTKEEDGMTFADKIQLQLIDTDPTIPPQDAVLNKAEKNGLYNAMDVASIWLDRALKEE